MFTTLIAKGRQIFNDLETYGFSDVSEVRRVRAIDVLSWLGEARGLTAKTFGSDSEEVERCWNYSRNLHKLPPGPVVFDVPRILDELQSMLALLTEFGVRAEEYGLGSTDVIIPSDVEKLLDRLIKGLPRSMYPLKHRRKSLPALQFDNEYDVQSLFHSLLRPWIRDIRVEEYTPTYAGKSTRMDFLLPKSGIVIEIKYVRDVQHAKNIGSELNIDVTHYRVHPRCNHLWAVIYDPHTLIQNPAGITTALDGPHADKNRSIDVRTFVLSAAPDS
jgi:hypothetical protein